MSTTPSSPISPQALSVVSWADPQRQQRFEAWLEKLASQHALSPASVRVASADASFRRYLRVDAQDGSTRIIMDAPPDKENCKPFVQVAHLMHDAGLNAPQVLDWHEADGFMLLSDLGDRTMMSAIDPERAQDQLSLYEQATDQLLRWQLASKDGQLPPYDQALLQRELNLFPDWYLSQHRKVTLDDKQQQVLDSTFALIMQRNLAAPQVYVHRDFMPRNLMMPTGHGPLGDQLGVLDFQDAVHGPITYDIASLMRDAFLTWEEDFVLDVTIRYWQKARKAGLMDF